MEYASSSDAAAYTVTLDPDSARQLVQQGGTVLLLDVPPNTSLGIDQKMFVIGPRFKGIKMIPPGTHFVYYSAISRHGNDVSPITGFFVHLEPSQVAVRRWDPREERLAPLADTDGVERYAASVRKFEFDAELGAYDVHHMKEWTRLSNYITPAVIDRHAPVGGDISVMSEAELADQHPRTASERRLQEHLQQMRDKWRNLGHPPPTPPGSEVPPDAVKNEDQIAAVDLLDRTTSTIPAPAGSQPSNPSSEHDVIMKDDDVLDDVSMAGGDVMRALSPSHAGGPQPSLSPSASPMPPLESVTGENHGPILSNENAHELTAGSESMEEGAIPDAETENDNKVASSSGREHEQKKTSGRCFYTKLPRLVKNRQVSAAELTALNMDKSVSLEALLLDKYSGQEELLLGEVQFAFVAFLMGQSLEAFGQWKAIIHLMCGCYDSPLHSRTQLFVKWLRVLYWQLHFGFQSNGSQGPGLPSDGLLDATWLSEDNFLQSLFTDWFTMLREARQVDTSLLNQANALRNLLEEALGWQLVRDPFLDDQEDDEFAPVVVPLEEAAGM